MSLEGADLVNREDVDSILYKKWREIFLAGKMKLYIIR